MTPDRERGELTGETCPQCGGAGVYDTGGFTPWGSPIEVGCDVCKAQPAAPEGQGEWLECSNCGTVHRRNEGHAPCNPVLPLLLQEKAALEAERREVLALGKTPIEQTEATVAATSLAQWVKTRFVHVEEFNEQADRIAALTERLGEAERQLAGYRKEEAEIQAFIDSDEPHEPLPEAEIERMVALITSPHAKEILDHEKRLLQENRRMRQELDAIGAQCTGENESLEHLMACARIGKETTVIGKARHRQLLEAESTLAAKDREIGELRVERKELAEGLLSLADFAQDRGVFILDEAKELVRKATSAARDGQERGE